MIRGTIDFRPASRVETISIMAFKAGTICNVATVYAGLCDRLAALFQQSPETESALESDFWT